MSDGIRFDDSTEDRNLLDDEVNCAPFAHASRTLSAPLPKLCDFAEWLPRLGPVLWLDRRQRNRTARDLANARSAPVLLDHPALIALCNARKLCAHHVISAQGPREWVSFHAASGEINARLYLLPDSDVLAWDEMIPALRITGSGSEQNEAPTHTNYLRRALGRFGQRWQARFVEFRSSSQPWLKVLDARPPLKVSLFGIELAGQIVREENADWISPLHR